MKGIENEIRESLRSPSLLPPSTDYASDNHEIYEVIIITISFPSVHLTVVAQKKETV